MYLAMFRRFQKLLQQGWLLALFAQGGSWALSLGAHAYAMPYSTAVCTSISAGSVLKRRCDPLDPQTSPHHVLYSSSPVFPYLKVPFNSSRDQTCSRPDQAGQIYSAMDCRFSKEPLLGLSERRA